MLAVRAILHDHGAGLGRIEVDVVSVSESPDTSAATSSGSKYRSRACGRPPFRPGINAPHISCTSDSTATLGESGAESTPVPQVDPAMVQAFVDVAARFNVVSAASNG